MFEFVKRVYLYVSNLSLIVILSIGLIIFIVWAAIFNLDQTVVSQGQIISEARTQVIQAPDGGILLDLGVHEGQEVRAGEVLATLQKDVANASYEVALAELESSIEMMNSVKDELNINQSLLRTGDVGYLEVARLKRQWMELRGRVRVNEEKLAQQKVFLDRTDIRSPVDGNVKILKINTIGGVLRPGDEIMQIAPLLKNIMIEVRVTPGDMGLLKLGLPVDVRFDAFDYAIYGSLHGTVSYISSDTLTEPGAGGMPIVFYRVHISIPSEDAEVFQSKGANLKLGMASTANIKTGTRSVIRYILKPLYTGFSGAMHEK